MTPMKITTEKRFCDLCGKDMPSRHCACNAEKGIYGEGERWRVQIAREVCQPWSRKPLFRLMDFCDDCLGAIVDFVKAKKGAAK